MKLNQPLAIALALAFALPVAAQTVSYPAPVHQIVGNGPMVVAHSDLDDDGDNDLVIANVANDTVSVHLNDGTGTFSFLTSINVPSAPTKLLLRDVDLNGSADILAMCGPTSQITVALNAGSATFLPATNYIAGFGPIDFATGDLNSDGFPDIVVANIGIGGLSVLINNGTGGYQFFGTDFAISGPTAVELGDIDNDGDDDIIAVSGTFSAVALIRNDTTTFTPVNFFATGFFPMDVKIVDVDHDQRRDIVTCNVGSGDVSILKNMVINGNYVFAPPVNIPAGDAPLSLALTNADNFLGVDIAVSVWNGQQVRILGNDGSGGFSHLLTRWVQPNPGSVASVDIDGDMDEDLVTVNVFAGSISTIENLSPAIPYPGTGEDIIVRTGVNGTIPSDGFGAYIKAVQENDVIDVVVESPNGTWHNDHAILGLQLYFPNFPPIPPMPGIWVNQFGFGVTIAIDTFALNPLGEAAIFVVPVELTGYSIMCQSLVLGPNAANGLLGGSHAHELRIMAP